MSEERLFPSIPILMVDDEKPWLRSLALTLKEMAGINNTIKCNDSRDVMKIMEEQEVFLVLLDLTMPYITGTDLLTMLHSDYPDVPVIVLSGMNQVETAVRCIKQGAFDYYVKTVEKERLLTGIQQAFAIRQLKKKITVCAAISSTLSETRTSSASSRPATIVCGRSFNISKRSLAAANRF